MCAARDSDAASEGSRIIDFNIVCLCRPDGYTLDGRHAHVNVIFDYAIGKVIRFADTVHELVPGTAVLRLSYRLYRNPFSADYEPFIASVARIEPGLDLTDPLARQNPEAAESNLHLLTPKAIQRMLASFAGVNQAAELSH